MSLRPRTFVRVAMVAVLAAACDRPATAPEARSVPDAASRVITGTGLAIYTDRTVWEAAVAAAGGTVQRYDFAGLTLGRITQTPTDYGPFAISVDAINTVSASFNPGISITPDASCSLDTGDCTVFTFDMIDPSYTALGGPHVNSLIMPQTIQAWGGYMVQAGYDAPAGNPTGAITVSTGSGDSFTLNDYVSGTGFGFVGFVTTNPTTTLTFTFVKSGSIVNEIFQVYNAAFAAGAVVTTPLQKLADLRAVIGAMGLSAGVANGFDAKLRDASAALSASDMVRACTDLQDVINLANALSGKKLAAANAATITSQATVIRTQLGC